MMRFAERLSDGQRIHQIKSAIHDFRQTESMSVMVYYSKLTQLWDELDTYEPIMMCNCHKSDCDIGKQHAVRRDSERLHQFLSGLLPVPYGPLRFGLFSQNPLPTLHRAFHIISREELARTVSPRPYMRRMAAAEEEFANLKEKVEFVCDALEPPVNHDWQMRIPDKWERQRQNENYKPLYCFAISHNPRFSEDCESYVIKIFILIPENCSLYHFANFIASSDGTACVGANSKIYVFGGGCGTRVWYMDVVRNSNEQENEWKKVKSRFNRKKRQPLSFSLPNEQGKEWKEAKACFNREKRQPLSFSLGNKIYALETCYSPMYSEVYDDDCRFEVLDTSTDCSCWLPLCSPPYPFGVDSVLGSWSTDSSGDQGDGYRIFIEGGGYLFVYDVDTNTWDKFKQKYNPMLKHDCSRPSDPDFGPPDYLWALHSVGHDFAPFPPQVEYTSDLRVLTGLKRSTPKLHQLACDHQDGLPLPFPVNVETDRMVKLSVPCKNSSRSLTGWDLESLWSLHCLPIQTMLFWQAIHLGGSSFCTLAYYTHSYCCCAHTYLYARVANFDITDATAAGGASDEPVFSAEYGLNKVYFISEDIDVEPLPCSKVELV